MQKFLHKGGVLFFFLYYSFFSFFCFFARPAVAAMSSTNYRIQWDSAGAGGEDTATSASYKLRSTVGEISNVSTSTSYRIDDGFRGGIYDPTVAFRLESQSVSSQVAATGLVGQTVTVNTTSGYIVGDYVAIIENEGSAQVAAMGRVVSLTGTTLTLDFLSGGAVALDGVGDYVYRLSGSALSFGSLSSSTVLTRIVAWDVNSDVDGGYSVFVFEDGDLASGTDTIADVADGAVTAGSSEYGGISSDASLASSTFDSQDTAFTSSFQEVASRTDNTFKGRDFLTVKVGVSGSQSAGTYTSALNLIFVGNY